MNYEVWETVCAAYPNTVIWFGACKWKRDHMKSTSQNGKRRMWKSRFHQHLSLSLVSTFAKHRFVGKSTNCEILDISICCLDLFAVMSVTHHRLRKSHYPSFVLRLTNNGVLTVFFISIVLQLNRLPIKCSRTFFFFFRCSPVRKYDEMFVLFSSFFQKDGFYCFRIIAFLFHNPHVASNTLTHTMVLYIYRAHSIHAIYTSSTWICTGQFVYTFVHYTYFMAHYRVSIHRGGVECQ